MMGIIEIIALILQIVINIINQFLIKYKKHIVIENNIKMNITDIGPLREKKIIIENYKLNLYDYAFSINPIRVCSEKYILRRPDKNKFIINENSRLYNWLNNGEEVIYIFITNNKEINYAKMYWPIKTLKSFLAICIFHIIWIKDPNILDAMHINNI